MAILKKPCFWQGNRRLLSCKLIQVTEWLPDAEDLEFAIKDLDKDKISWVIKRRQIAMVKKKLKQGRVQNYREVLWQYALFRKKPRRT